MPRYLCLTSCWWRENYWEGGRSYEIEGMAPGEVPRHLMPQEVADARLAAGEKFEHLWMPPGKAKKLKESIRVTKVEDLEDPKDREIAELRARVVRLEGGVPEGSEGLPDTEMMTVIQIKEALDALGVHIPARATKAELLELLKAAGSPK